ncbi:MAG: hypothetical protein J0I29_05560 [Rhizobiales bacterium]|nr:hypothetical protein [Hyphomicrobiales bacterium]
MNRPNRTDLAWIGAAAVAMSALIAPVLWNGYPLLQYDTGGYLARWYEGYLVPSRSTVFGIFLHLGEGLHFWPNVLVQSALTVWIVYLVLRAFRLARPLRLAALVVLLSVFTGLPWLTSILLTDIFAGLSVLALYLFIFRADDLRQWERIALFVLIAFSVATHSATLAVLLAVLAFVALLGVFRRGVAVARRLIVALAAMACGAVMLLAANFALSGQLAWTPGGYGIAFARMLQDGIVAQYLNDRCPDARLKLCPYRNELPETGDQFLWEDGPFQDLGRFEGMDQEMREIVLNSLRDYPARQIEAALKSTLKQLTMVATGTGVNNRVVHTYGIMGGYVQEELKAMRAARQQRGELDFSAINRLHVPVALVSMAMMLLGFVNLFQKRRDDLALLAATVAVATLTNASVCAILSGPHDRYGARIAWVSTFVVIVAAMRYLKSARASPSEQPADDMLAEPEPVSRMA